MIVIMLWMCDELMFVCVDVEGLLDGVLFVEFMFEDMNWLLLFDVIVIYV